MAATTTAPRTESVLIVYVHGFKGTDVTFEQFPERLQHVVHESIVAAGFKSTVVSKVFPVFETKGELRVATDRFVEWLANETVQLETATASRAKVVLCGHSMGGLLIADAALGIAHGAGADMPSTSNPPLTGQDNAREKNESHATAAAPMWPRIVALIAFDTPYLGLNPIVFKNGITKYAEHVELAKNVVGGLGLGGAVWGMFGSGNGSGEQTQATNADAPDNATTNTNDRKQRNGSTKPPTAQTPSSSSSSSSSTRWAMPALPSFKTLATAASAAAVLTTTAAAAYYRREDLVGGWTWVTDHAAHIGMFNPKTNEAFYALGLEVGRAVLEALERTREEDTAAGVAAGWEKDHVR
ncbi:hypothetical protein QFC19_008437 [Naganishia cerealis]|uniref:Uncharacterized protein n=1 Tax=Naganishia cerealis TaxID=610337 RepID=A0ACC2V2I0_9TREE|nr:hypothetical protein QFC19_008437 [Naganishia cerealis]